jgi:hypothetical protein
MAAAWLRGAVLHHDAPRPPAAFDYLYGRSDDHRHYWWKLRAAGEAIAERRRDPDGFRRRWEAFLPGRFAEAAWYPDGPSRSVPKSRPTPGRARGKAFHR